jgi:hypothetical protein
VFEGKRELATDSDPMLEVCSGSIAEAWAELGSRTVQLFNGMGILVREGTQA